MAQGEALGAPVLPQLEVHRGLQHLAQEPASLVSSSIIVRERENSKSLFSTILDASKQKISKSPFGSLQGLL